MDIDLTGRHQLSPFELYWLVTGVLAAIAADRYVEITIRAHQLATHQIKLITRWGAHTDLQSGRERPSIVTWVEVPS